MKNNPPLKAIRTFESAARLLNFRRASGELNVTASAVSHQIKLLENYLGQALFIRHERKIRLSEAGRFYYQEVSRAMALIDHATDQLKHERANSTLRISAAPIFVSRWLMPRLHKFYDAYPDIELNIHPTSQRADPVGSDHDLLIRYASTDGLLDNRQQCVVLFDLHLTPVCSNDLYRHWRESGKLPPHIPLLEDTLTEGHQWHCWFKKYPEPPSLRRQAVFQYDSQTQLFEPAIAGYGVALILLEMVLQDLQNGVLKRLFDDQVLDTGKHMLALYRKQSPQAARVKLFVEWMLAECD